VNRLFSWFPKIKKKFSFEFSPIIDSLNLSLFICRRLVQQSDHNGVVQGPDVNEPAYFKATGFEPFASKAYLGELRVAVGASGLHCFDRRDNITTLLNATYPYRYVIC
jgi:hypothetical protein